MRFNYKAFPYKFEGCGDTLKPSLNSPCCGVCPCSDMCRWKESSEKELRERMNEQNQRKKCDCYNPIDIKEILGE